MGQPVAETPAGQILCHQIGRRALSGDFARCRQIRMREIGDPLGLLLEAASHLPLNNELDTEAAALYAYGGKVSIRLLEADPDGGAILIERVTPGHTLVTLPDDDQTTRLAIKLHPNDGQAIHIAPEGL